MITLLAAIGLATAGLAAPAAGQDGDSIQGITYSVKNIAPAPVPTTRRPRPAPHGAGGSMAETGTGTGTGTGGERLWLLGGLALALAATGVVAKAALHGHREH